MGNNAAEGINDIASKQGAVDDSFDPIFHAASLSKVANECTKQWERVVSSKTLPSDDYRRIDAFADEGGSDITLTLQLPVAYSAGWNRDVYNDTATVFKVFLKDNAGADLVVGGIDPGEAVNVRVNEAIDGFELADIKGKAPSTLSTVPYGDFNNIANASNPTGTYFITGNGSEFSNQPPRWDLQPTTPYTFIKTVLNTASTYYEQLTFYSDFDSANERVGQVLVRAGGNFGAAVSAGWKPAFAPDSFAVYQPTQQEISASPLTPSFLNNLEVVQPQVGFELFPIQGSMRNVSNTTMARVIGEFAIQVEKTGGGGTDTLNIWSESSADNVTFTVNPNSLRKIEVANDGESYYSLTSFVSDWAIGEYVRFKMSATSNDLSLIPPSLTTDVGEVVGLAAFWSMTRVG